ncbi:MAG: hypothetical protein MHM6MM_004524 [Cercozoa sp. M6MM]
MSDDRMNAWKRVHKWHHRGLEFAYRYCPSPEPKGLVFMFHGFLDHSGTFDLLIPRLSDEFTYVALDFRGHGDSDWQPKSVSSYNLIDFISDACLFIRWFQLSFGDRRFPLFPAMHAKEYVAPRARSRAYKKHPMPSFIVAHSLGSIVSTAAAAVPGLGIQGLVCIENAGVGAIPLKLEDRRRAHSFRWVLRGALQPRSRRFYESSEEALTRISESHVSGNAEVARHLGQQALKTVGAGGVCWKSDPRLSMHHEFWHASPGTEAQILKHLQCPVLVIGGKEGFGAKFREHFEPKVKAINKNKRVHLRLAMLPGGHHLHCEQENVDAVAEVIAKFLRKQRERWETLQEHSDDDADETENQEIEEVSMQQSAAPTRAAL